MTNLKQQLLQKGFVTQLTDNQLDFYHNKYKTTIINPTNVPFETLIALLKAIRKLDKIRNPNVSYQPDPQKTEKEKAHQEIKNLMDN